LEFGFIGTYCYLKKDENILNHFSKNNIELHHSQLRSHIMNKIIITLIFSTFLLADFSANVQVSANAGSYNKMPDIAVDGNGTVHVVWINNDNNKNVFYAKSTDHGGTFSTPVQINMHNGYVSDIMYSGPKIAVFGGLIHVIWADQRNGYDETNIFYSQSTDGGDTWTEEVPIGDVSAFNLYPEIITSELGEIHVIYYSYNRRFLNFEYIFHIASSDSGQTFSDDEIVNNYTEAIPCECCPAEILILNDGTKMVGFRNDNNDIRDTFATFSGADETEWGSLTRLSFDDYIISACPSSGPGMSRLGEEVAISYMAAMDNTKKVFLKVSRDDASSFSDSILVDPSAAADIRQDHPYTAITDGNWIHVIWEDQRGGNDIYYGGMNVSSGGLSNIQVLNDDGLDVTQMAPQMDDDGHFVYIVWEDYRDTQQIYFTSNYDPDAGVGDEINPTAFEIQGVYPNPFNNNLTIDFSLVQPSEIKLAVIDISGRAVKNQSFGHYSPGNHSISWNGKNYSAGVYFIQLTSDQAVQTRKVLYLK